MLPIIFVVPIIQLLILVHAATFEMKNIKLTILDFDNSSLSKRLIFKFQHSPFFKVNCQSISYNKSLNLIEKNQTDAILTISHKFESDIINNSKSSLHLSVNAINGMVASLTYYYISSIVDMFSREISSSTTVATSLNIQYSYWYNSKLEYKSFMVPGILVLLTTLIGFVLSSLNIVREKEIGTIEQINVTPIEKYQFISGKLIPILIIGLMELAIGLTIGKLLFQIPTRGSIILLFCIATFYLILAVGMGLLVSTIVDNQQQAMFVSFFFMIIFILMSGLFTAVENMPLWAQKLNYLNPIAYFIRINRMILLKGSSFSDIAPDAIAIFVYSLFTLLVATLRYRKTT